MAGWYDVHAATRGSATGIGSAVVKVEPTKIISIVKTEAPDELELGGVRLAVSLGLLSQSVESGSGSFAQGIRAVGTIHVRPWSRYLVG
jgi:hypothetical protein